MSAKFTRGPWYAAELGAYFDYDGDCRVIIGDDRRVAVCQHHGSVEDEANAALIAAAPDLYEALETLTLIVGLTAFKHEAQRAALQEAMDKARAALTKAVAK